MFAIYTRRIHGAAVERNRKLTELFVQAPKRSGSFFRYSCRIESARVGSRVLWFDVAEEFCDWVTPRADPFLVATLFQLMIEGEPVRVRGDVSASLLEPLHEYMTLWSSWRPGVCRPISISADELLEDHVAEGSDSLLLFSGGMDAQTTLQRHIRGEAGNRTRKIGACLYARGFMNGLEDTARYRAALENAKASVSAFGEGQIPLIPIVSNWQELHTRTMPDSIGTGLISFLHLFKSRFGRGMLSSSMSTKWDMRAYGSHPFSDPLLGHSSFQIECDDTASTRVDKALYLSDKPEVLDRLLVCHDFDDEAKNCGACEKCFRTAICFIAHGQDVPRSIPIDWRACEKKKIHLKTLRDDPEVCREVFLNTVQQNLKHPELAKFRRWYQIYLTKEAIKETLLVWGLRKGLSNDPSAPWAMSGTD